MKKQISAEKKESDKDEALNEYLKKEKAKRKYIKKESLKVPKNAKKQSKKKSKTKERSREKSMKEKTEKKEQKSNIKIHVPLFDDSNLNEPKTIEDYIQNNKSDLIAGKIDLSTYIGKNDVDHEQLYIYLEKILSDKIDIFFDNYKKNFFKLTLQQRIQLEKKLKEKENIIIPDFIWRNMVPKTIINIENIFINILSELIENPSGTITCEKIDEIFIKNNVFFEECIDIKVPYKYGTKELKFYSLLNDLYYYFHSSELRLIDKFETFKILTIFIKNIKNDDENLILKCNYLINILYMYLDSNNIEKNIFQDIVTTCIPFNEVFANKILEIMKSSLSNGDVILINNIPITQYQGIITGVEKVILEDKTKNIKIETFSKYINWYMGLKLDTQFMSEDFTLCLTFPENLKYNVFTLGEIGELVNKFFELMIHSPPMKQAMIIDNEACKYKYFFNNEKLLKEFNNNVHLVPLPFNNYFGFTDKKSFDIYINVSYKTNNSIIKILKKYNIFFITKSHEFKHASRIYLRLYDGKIKIKTPIKEFKKLKGKKRKYLVKIFNNTQNNLNLLSRINNPKKAQKKNLKIDEYGELLEFSLFGYKLDELFLKSIIFCLTESSWKLSPEEFYNQFSNKMIDDKTESLKDLCKEDFLRKLKEYYAFSIKEKNYGNLMISKDSYISMNNRSP